MEIVDKDFKNGFISVFQYAVKTVSYFFHVSFLETCKSYQLCPSGLNIRKKPFIEFESDELKVFWKETLVQTENDLLEALCVGICERMFKLEEKFWKELRGLEESHSPDVVKEWLVKLYVHLEKKIKKIRKTKRKKLDKLATNPSIKEHVSERFTEHLSFFTFFNDFVKYCEEFYPDIIDLGNLVTLNVSCHDASNTSNSLEDLDDSETEVTINELNIEEQKSNGATLLDGRYQGKFGSPNVINLSSRNLTKAEISLLSKGLKFVPTPKNINKAQIKEELEIFGRKLRLMWYFRNEEQESISNPFKKKSKFNPKNKDAAIELYLSRLEEEILALENKSKYSNLTKEERNAIYSLKDDTSIVIKEADKGSGIVVWDREDYLAEAQKQLSDKEVYQQIKGDIESPLIKIIKTAIRKVRDRRDISDETLDYFLVNNPKLGRFYLLPKIHKRLHNVPGRPVISNSGYYTENISAFIEYHLKPIAQNVKSYIKDTNDFLNKIAKLPPLPEDLILCTIDVVGLYPNIPHDEGMIAIRQALEMREDKSISTDSLIELAECVLKNNMFEHNSLFYKQLRGTAIGTKMAPPYAIIYMSYFEEKFLEEMSLKPLVWWRYIDDIFMLWQHGEEELKKFLECLNCYHPTIKFTADYSRDKINFLDVEVIKKDNRLITDLFIKPTDTHQYLHATSCHVFHSKKSIPYSQALRLNRICSENSFLDKRCNQLEVWLKDRGYSDKLVRSQILKARKVKRMDLLDKTRIINKDKKLVLNITYNPAFSKLKNIMSGIHILLTPDKEHSKVFNTLPIVGFRRAKSLKDILVRAKIPSKEKREGFCGPCNRPRCQICKRVKKTNTFRSTSTKRFYKIKPENLSCCSENVVYLITCKTCKKQYVGSSVEFRLRFNNYRCSHRNFLKGKEVKQESFHAHYEETGHNGESDWEFILIDQADSVEDLRKRESFWQHELNTFKPVGLNDREVALIKY